MIDFDFLPASFHQRRNEQRFARRTAVLVAVMVCAMSGWTYAHLAEWSKLDSERRQVHHAREQIRVLRVTMEQLEQQRAVLSGREELIGVLEDPASAAVVLAAVSRALPEAVAVTYVRYRLMTGAEVIVDASESAKPDAEPLHTPPAALAGIERLPTLNIRGVSADAPSIGQLAAALTGSRYFTDVSTQMGTAVTYGDRRGIGFEMQCRVLPQNGKSK